MQRSRINATKYITLFVRKYQDPDTQEWKSFGNTMPIKRVNIASAKKIIEGENQGLTLVNYLDLDDPIDPWRKVIATTPVDEIRF